MLLLFIIQRNKSKAKQRVIKSSLKLFLSLTEKILGSSIFRRLFFSREKNFYFSGTYFVLATGQIVTSIQLEHTLYPPNVLPPSLNAFENIVFPSSHLEQITPPTFIYMTSPPPQSTQRPPNQLDTTERPPNHLITTQRRKKKPTTSHSTTVSLSDGIANNIFLNPSIQQSNNNHNNNNNNNQPPPQSNNNNINNNEECGVSTHPNNMVNLLIAKGMKTMPGQWPWLVAIFIVRLQYEFQCAGSILTNKHIITGKRFIRN